MEIKKVFLFFLLFNVWMFVVCKQQKVYKCWWKTKIICWKWISKCKHTENLFSYRRHTDKQLESDPSPKLQHLSKCNANCRLVAMSFSAMDNQVLHQHHSFTLYCVCFILPFNWANRKTLISFCNVH